MVKIGASDSRERAILDSQFGGGATTWAPATWYVAVSTTTPNDDGTGFTEPVGGSYARVAMTNNATNWPAAATVSGTTTKKNGTAATFPTPSGNWGSLSYYGLFTASTGGSPEYSNPLDSSITANTGNTPVEFAISQIVIEAQ